MTAERFRDDLRKSLGDLIAVAEEFHEIGGEIAATTGSDALARTVRQLLRSLTNSLRSVVTLVEHGCGTDALRLTRTIFETAVNIHYLHSYPEKIEDFADFEWVKKKRHYEFLLKFSPIQAQLVDAASLAELNAEYARVSPRFTGDRGKVRPNWVKLSFREVALLVRGEALYLGFYPIVSSLIHMDAMGLKFAGVPTGAVQPVPSGANILLAIQIAITTYAIAAIAADEVLNAGTSKRIEAAFEKFRESVTVRAAVATTIAKAPPSSQF